MYISELKDESQRIKHVCYMNGIHKIDFLKGILLSHQMQTEKPCRGKKAESMLLLPKIHQKNYERKRNNQKGLAGESESFPCAIKLHFHYVTHVSQIPKLFVYLVLFYPTLLFWGRRDTDAFHFQFTTVVVSNQSLGIG